MELERKPRDMSKVYLVHQEVFIPKEGISSNRVKVFKYLSDARQYCEEHSCMVDENGYNSVTAEEEVQYIISDEFIREYMRIEETDLHEHKNIEFSKLGR